MYDYQIARRGKDHIRPINIANSEWMTLEFLEEPSVNKVGMKTSESSPHILSDVNKLLKKGIMVNTAHEEGGLISPIFLRPKSDGNN